MKDLNVKDGIAELRNVRLLMTGILATKDRPRHLPGLVCFYGPSGYGKSRAAAYAASVYNAYYVELKSTWSVKYFLQMICKEMTLPYEKSATIAELAEKIIEQLTNSNRCLILDEFDYLVDKNKVDIVRDLFEGAKAPIILIGEENLPLKLKKWERTHGRILEFIAAQPASIEDASALRALYKGKINVADDLLEKVHKLAKGSIRRICVNLAKIESEGLLIGKPVIGLEEWGSRELYTGYAPVRREV